jgi:hypothetical protein
MKTIITKSWTNPNTGNERIFIIENSKEFQQFLSTAHKAWNWIKSFPNDGKFPVLSLSFLYTGNVWLIEDDPIVVNLLKNLEEDRSEFNLFTIFESNLPRFDQNNQIEALSLVVTDEGWEFQNWKDGVYDESSIIPFEALIPLEHIGNFHKDITN